MRINRLILIAIAGALVGVAVVCAGMSQARGDGSWRWPAGIEPGLTGTLGEWRAVHLHQGIDISTRMRNGIPVYAAGDGRLAKVMAWRRGYGNALILDHGSGVQSLYGHLDGFEETVHGLGPLVSILKTLYNADDLTLNFSEKAPVYHRGELLAASGESGSGVSHLHFEFRDGRGTPNPLAFIPVKDDMAPEITDVYVCLLANGGLAYEKRYPVTNANGKLALGSGIIVIPRDGTPFVKVACHDRLGAENRVAVHRLRLHADGEARFELVFDHVSWGDSRYATDLYDLSKLRLRGKSSYAYPLAYRRGGGYAGATAKNGGFLSIGEETVRLRIAAQDRAGNEAAVEFALRRDPRMPLDTSGYTFADRSRYTSVSDRQDTCTIRVAAHSLRENAWIAIHSVNDDAIAADIAKRLRIDADRIASVHAAGFEDAQLTHPVGVSIRRPPGASVSEVGKYIICSFFEGEHPRALPTSYSRAGNSFEAYTKSLGRFALVRDDVPPAVFLPPTHEAYEDRGAARRLRIYAFDRIAGLDLRSVECLVDGEVMSYRYDNDRKWIELELPRAYISAGVHHLLVRCRDNAGNRTTFRTLLVF